MFVVFVLCRRSSQVFLCWYVFMKALMPILMPSAAAWQCTPTGGVETAVAVGVPSRAGGSFGEWLQPFVTGDRVGVY